MKSLTLIAVLVVLHETQGLPFFRKFQHHDKQLRTAGKSPSIRDRKSVTGTEEERCDAFTEAFQEIVDAVDSAGDDAAAQQMEDQFQGGAGFDIHNPEHVREQACQLAAIETIGDLAVVVGVTEQEMRQQYDLFCRYMRLMVEMLQEHADSSYLTPEARRVARALVHFFQLYEDFGYYDLE